jgi:orotate phosphoribosyltransferase-like protein
LTHKINNEELKLKAVELFAAGGSWRKVADELNISLSTLQRMMMKYSAATAVVANFN